MLNKLNVTNCKYIKITNSLTEKYRKRFQKKTQNSFKKLHSYFYYF